MVLLSNLEAVLVGFYVCRSVICRLISQIKLGFSLSHFDLTLLFIDVLVLFQTLHFAILLMVLLQEVKFTILPMPGEVIAYPLEA